jgi:methylenetetrahydrofolate--tRNA-(uracil-5-)-methyltransferase
VVNHITGGHIVTIDDEGKRSFQPMNINFGLFPPIEVVRQPGVRMSGVERGRAKKRAMSARALRDVDAWLGRAAAEAAE